jgi:hypothetical protein
MKIDRRRTIGILALAGTVLPLVEAQTPTQAAPAQPPSASADLQSARDDLRTDAQRIATVKLPRSTEPAFHFRA